MCSWCGAGFCCKSGVRWSLLSLPVVSAESRQKSDTVRDVDRVHCVYKEIKHAQCYGTWPLKHCGKMFLCDMPYYLRSWCSNVSLSVSDSAQLRTVSNLVLVQVHYGRVVLPVHPLQCALPICTLKQAGKNHPCTPHAAPLQVWSDFDRPCLMQAVPLAW